MILVDDVQTWDDLKTLDIYTVSKDLGIPLKELYRLINNGEFPEPDRRYGITWINWAGVTIRNYKKSLEEAN